MGFFCDNGKIRGCASSDYYLPDWHEDSRVINVKSITMKKQVIIFLCLLLYNWLVMEMWLFIFRNTKRSNLKTLINTEGDYLDPLRRSSFKWFKCQRYVFDSCVFTLTKTTINVNKASDHVENFITREFDEHLKYIIKYL